jgi:hypothetical protein
VTPESVASIPPEVAAPLPPPPLAAPPQRRTPTHTFRLLDQEPAEKKPKAKPRRRKRSGPWLKRLVLLLVIGGIGAGGYWYFAVQNKGKPPPWAGLVDRVKQLVSRSTQPPGNRPAPPPRRTVTPPGATRSAAAPPGSATAPAPAAAAAPQPAALPAVSPFARYDRLSDSLSRAVRSFQDRASLFDGGRIDCNGLASGLVGVENLWISYNNERKARMAEFDERRATQDQALYASVDAVESRFERSGCPRP